jgi:N-acetylmuramoyl-L-alanine amidase
LGLPRDSLFVRLRSIGLSILALCSGSAIAEATTSGGLRARTDTIVVHAISGPLQDCPRGKLEFSGAPGDAGRWKTFFDKHPFLGIHYVVDRQGRVEASTPENRRANHALNASESSIGIELVHNGDGVEPFSPAQLGALIKLLKEIRIRYPVAIENVKGHADVDTRTFACGGKVYKGRMDPGENFPWAHVRAALRGEPVLVAMPVLVSRADWVARMGLGRPPLR